MGSKWRKVKLALGSNLCVYVPRSSEDSPPAAEPGERLSDVGLLSKPNWAVDSSGTLTPEAPVPFSPRSRLSISRSRSSKKTCSICLATMRRGDGHAIFTAECSHSFHFHCITSNVKHGNEVCPVCRAKWKEIPFQSPSVDLPRGKARISPLELPQNNALMTVIRRMPPPRPDLHRQQAAPSQQAVEPPVFDDDEALDREPELAAHGLLNEEETELARTVEMKALPEVSATPWSKSCDDFSVLVHLRAAASAASGQTPSPNHVLTARQASRAPVDLVTVLDISGSMAGTKLSLLKRAMGFVIQNLGPSDRLSVIAFSSTARRLFPLRSMSDAGRQLALQAVNSLVANGGTNIGEGLKKAAKVMGDRKDKNSVASIILLSDGQDTYNLGGPNQSQQPNSSLLCPLSIRRGDDADAGFQIPVHAFGFGMDHDASSMHSISETSGGTFSFIETEAAIQDAFAQCIGGLLSVVVQEMKVTVECVHHGLRIGSLKAGSYPNRIAADGRSGSVDVGDLYADEERDFLVSIDVPAESAACETPLVKAKCVYKDPLTKDTVTVETKVVKIERTEGPGRDATSVEVDRQRNRLRAAEAMAQARAEAEHGALANAIGILENCRRALSKTVSAKSQDKLCIALDAELKEMQERMATRHAYETTGRAYILSGLSSHSWQRATARGDSTDGSSLVQAYQTPSMTEMLTQSQAMLLGSPSAVPRRMKSR